MTSLYDEIFKRFNIRITKGNEIEAFAIMPNHLHLLIFVKKQTTSICAGKWKAFSASAACWTESFTDNYFKMNYSILLIVVQNHFHTLLFHLFP